MNKKVLVSFAVIIFVIASVTGATMAWFTAEASIDPNTFEAGTVTLNAVDTFIDETTNTLENWNPGECEDKEITIEYTGTKQAFLRMQIIEKWDGIDPDPEDYNREYYERNAPHVSWTGWDPNEWIYFDGWWYYNSGKDGNRSTVIDDNTIYAVDDSFKDNPITIVTEVCLDGPEVGNNFQGAVYTINAKFQAIQASGDWNWDDNINFDTGLVD